MSADAEPAPAPLSNTDAPILVDQGQTLLTPHQHAISSTLLARGGTPLVSQSVILIDPATGQQVGDPLTTDEAGVNVCDDDHHTEAHCRHVEVVTCLILVATKHIADDSLHGPCRRRPTGGSRPWASYSCGPPLRCC